MKITVETSVKAPLQSVWDRYTTASDITQWNFASPDWHAPHATVDLREGGLFSSRMEAKDGSMGFDFAGTYTKIEPLRYISYQFGDRTAEIEFAEHADAVKVTVSFDPENEYPLEFQKQGWQAILDNFKQYVEGLA
ncbi:SRPBCC family protein [Undibacterium cyanobacteriorum]|uniref:SRPBCC family protein n=1 Tax=Undibacterium cyanobacteriorum TaxID=3073561 RepID=A0ABY9RLH6_9BURK|nr:SRPBCC family protein [Undibacterium sp. 20NA77.5]WMW81811.1 SRPBCC family protein [Undibacterium sp. 20NA77.5]